jgi:ABC-type phosphate/phosphonate transport system substrate-binding protein
MTPDGKQKLRALINQIAKISEDLKDLLAEEKDEAVTEEDEEHLDTIENVSEWLTQHNDDLNEILWEK